MDNALSNRIVTIFICTFLKRLLYKVLVPFILSEVGRGQQEKRNWPCPCRQYKIAWVCVSFAHKFVPIIDRSKCARVVLPYGTHKNAYERPLNVYLLQISERFGFVFSFADSSACLFLLFCLTFYSSQLTKCMLADANQIAVTYNLHSKY